MNPEVQEAIPKLVERGILSADRAAHLLRIARRDLVSVYYELRFLLYGGVLMVTAGVGLLIKENLAQIGPVTITLGIGLAAAAALIYVARTAPPFAWEEVPSSNPAFDYLLLLGTLLIGSELVWIETQFTVLGPQWPWHLLMFSLLAGVLSVRYDSRMVFSVALTSFASWAGVTASPLEKGFWDQSLGTLRLQTAACGVVFILLAWLLRSARRKRHFDPVAVHLGWFLLLTALFSGTWEENLESLIFAATLLACSLGLAWYAYQRRLYSFFAMGAAGVYLALGDMGADGLHLAGSHASVWWLFWYAFLAFAGLLVALRIYRKMNEPL